MKAKRTVADQLVATCRHFTGIQNEMCAVGINYRKLVGGDDSGWALRLPCIANRDGLSVAQQAEADKAVICANLNFPSREEAEQEAREQDEAVERHLAALREGRCPTCGQEVEKRQVGPCVYGSCGHRLYQGHA